MSIGSTNDFVGLFSLEKATGKKGGGCMKKLSMILTVLIIFGTSAIGYTSDEYVVFEGIFERGNLVFERAIANKKTGKKGNGTPVSQFGNFLGSSGEATLRVCNVAEADKISSATISINGNVVLGSSNFNQNVDCIKKTVNLMGGDNILEVQLKSKPGGKVSIEILQPDIPPAGDVCGDTDDGYPNTVIATTTVGPKYGPYGGIAVSPYEEFAYVSNFMEGTVSVINTSDNTLIDTDPITIGGIGPMGISMTPVGAYAYVSNYVEGKVYVINTSNHTVIDTIIVGDDPDTEGLDGCPFGISMTPDGEYAYVSDYCNSTVSVIRTSDRTVIDTITVGNEPTGISMTPVGAYAYVSNFDSGTVSIIQTSNNTVIDTITVGDNPDTEELDGCPFGISMTPDGEYAYVSDYCNNAVWIIRTSDRTVIDTDPSTVEIDPITVGNEPAGISMTPDGKYVYVINSGDDVADDVTGDSTGDGTVSVIRTCDNTLVDTIQVGKQPYGGIAVSPDGMFVYVGNFEDGTVSVIGISDETTQ